VGTEKAENPAKSQRGNGKSGEPCQIAKWERKKQSVGDFQSSTLCFWKGQSFMSLSFFLVNADYCDFLRKADPRVPYAGRDKAKRPFVGIVLEIASLKYYAPLSSPKPKHSHMKNLPDFIKICGGKLGVINLNNMIPVHPDCLTKIDLSVFPHDDEEEKKYKSLLGNQLSQCNKNKDKILAKAAKLREIIISGKARPDLAKRCCDFSGNEKSYALYFAQNRPDRQ
jgi:protein AbiQ